MGFILFMWMKKDLPGYILSNADPEYLVPVMVTSVAVTSVKVIALAAVILLVKWLPEKFRKN